VFNSIPVWKIHASVCIQQWFSIFQGENSEISKNKFIWLSTFNLPFCLANLQDKINIIDKGNFISGVATK
jgi:hypothetical protein